MRTRLLISTAAVAAMAAACSSSGSGGDGSAGGGGGSSQPAGGSDTVTISVKNDRLTTADGRTLYYNTVDTAQRIKCVDECASEWPPVIGQPEVGAGLDEDDFATASRPDGGTQVTFYGHPLYMFDEDQPGTAKGDGMSDEGGHWTAATPEQAEGGGSDEPSEQPSEHMTSDDSGY